MAKLSERLERRRRAPSAAWDRDLPRLAAAVAVLGVVWVTIWQLHPELLISASTTTGGDTGAHFALPAFLRSNLLSQGSLTGWYPGWYDGFPLYTYYFVLPDLVGALASYLLPYGTAFKIATVAGSVAMPACAYAMGRLFRLRAPIPSALAVATLPFLFDSSFTIDGGNLFSTLAGEYAFSLSLSLSFLVIGLFARGVRSGRGAIITPVVLAACILSHLVPVVFALLGIAMVTLLELLGSRRLLGDEAVGLTDGLVLRPERSRREVLSFAARSLALGLGLTAWWWVPFALGQGLANPMGYVNVTTYVAKLFPGGDLWVVLLAFAAALFGLHRQSRFVVTFTATAIASGLAFVLAPQGSLWNERLIPLWFISLYLLAGWLVGTAIARVALWRRLRARDRGIEGIGPPVATGRWEPGAVAGPIVALALGIVAVVPPLVPGLLPASALKRVGITPGANQVSAWAAWNYSGYEGREAYPEYRGVIHTMKQAAKYHGCGRAMWEYSPDLDRFGTTMALMLLPYWTKNCVGSQEGLFFESSATVPYHFLIQAEVSPSPSNPQIGLPYTGVDLKAAVAHLRILGVRYLMLSSAQTQMAMSQVPGAVQIASSGPWPKVGTETSPTTWKIYLLAGAAAVSGLSHLPVVVPGIDASAEAWKRANVAWFMDPSRHAVPLAASGPPSWPRGSAATRRSPATPKARVTHISIQPSTISFDVDRIGSPVVVKSSWYPRWHATGASGPFRISPNLMAVVPTSAHVELTYGSDAADLLGRAVTLASLAVVAAMGGLALRARWARRRRSRI